MTKEERKKYNKNYMNSPKGKATRKRNQKLSKTKAARKKYEQTARGKAQARKHRQSAKHKVWLKNHCTPELNSWNGMVQRCTNSNSSGWKYYGKVGVTVCKRWRTYKNFLADMGKRPAGTTLGRRLDSGNYKPGNVFWQTKQEQMAEATKKRALRCSEKKA